MTIAERRLQAASDVLWDHWQRGARIGELPEAVRPGDA